MFRFAHEEMLYGLLIIPLLVLIYIIASYRRKKLKRRFASSELHPLLMPDASKFRKNLKFIIYLFSLAVLIFALAGPRVGSRLKEVETKGRELIFALDVSNSMLAEDMQPNRLEVAKQALNNLLNKLDNDKVGLIVFAGDAYVQIPVTTDFAAARLFLNTVSTNMVSKQGTAIGSAIDLAVKSFTSEDTPEGVPAEATNSKAIVIITDGENHEEGVFEAAEKAAARGIVVHAIGLGDPRGVPLPLYPGSNDFRKDREGNPVVSKLDEATLKRIASITGGYYIKAGRSGAGISRLMEKLDELQSEQYTAKVFAEYAERYQYFLGLGLFLLLIEFIVMEKKNRWLSKIKLFG